MPRYFFRLTNGGVLNDPDGEELSDDAAARLTAIQIFAETLEGKSGHLEVGGDYEVVVLRDPNRPIYSIVAQGRRLR